MNKYFYCKEAEMQEDKFIIRKIESRNIGGIIIKGKYFFIHDYCPHAGAPICKGKIENICVEKGELIALRCPWHSWQFNIEDGKPIIGQIKQKLICFDYEIISNDIYIKF
jgi:nitrite reductase (NADH) small subunit